MHRNPRVIGKARQGSGSGDVNKPLVRGHRFDEQLLKACASTKAWGLKNQAANLSGGTRSELVLLGRVSKCLFRCLRPGRIIAQREDRPRLITHRTRGLQRGVFVLSKASFFSLPSNLSFIRQNFEPFAGTRR